MRLKHFWLLRHHNWAAYSNNVKWLWLLFSFSIIIIIIYIESTYHSAIMILLHHLKFQNVHFIFYLKFDYYYHHPMHQGWSNMSKTPHKTFMAIGHVWPALISIHKFGHFRSSPFTENKTFSGQFLTFTLELALFQLVLSRPLHDFKVDWNWMSWWFFLTSHQFFKLWKIILKCLSVYRTEYFMSDFFVCNVN